MSLRGPWNAGFRILAGGLLFLCFGNGLAGSQDTDAAPDSAGGHAISLESLSSEQLIKIRNASEMELVYGDSTGLIRHYFSKESAEWDVEGHVLLVPDTCSLPPAASLRTIRIRNDPHPVGVALVGVPTGVLLTVVGATLFGSRRHQGMYFDLPTGGELAAIGAGIFVVGPVVAYHLLGRWQSIYIVRDSRSGWQRAFQHER